MIVANNSLRNHDYDTTPEAQYLRQNLLPKYTLSLSLTEFGLSPARELYLLCHSCISDLIQCQPFMLLRVVFIYARDHEKWLGDCKILTIAKVISELIEILRRTMPYSTKETLHGLHFRCNTEIPWF